MSLHNSNSDRIIVMHYPGGTLNIWLGAASGAVMFSDGAVSTGEPHHVAVWYEPGTNLTYMMIDGVTQQDTYTGNLLAVNNPKVYIGAFEYSSIPYKRYLGNIDEVAVYDGAVTAATFANRWSGPTNAYAYDANGNRTSQDKDGTVTTFGYPVQTNRLTAIDSSAIQRDLAGNRIADVGGTRTYSYNNAGRLSEVLDNAVPTAGYVHNALGQRTKKTVGAANTVYVYDLAGNLLAEHDATGTLIRDYVWLNGAPVAQVDQGEVFSYLHVDHLGTPRLATDDTQAVVWRWDGDAFGTTLADEDPDGNGTGVTVNLRFPGQYFDAESGFHYNYFRTYDPSTGRYLESDPIGLQGGLNTYGYVGGNPLGFVDPFGLEPTINIYPVNEDIYRNSQKIPDPPPGVISVAGHGNENLMVRRFSQLLNARRLADLIRREEGFKDAKKVILLSCNVGRGEDSLAQRLADELGKPVEGPNKYFFADGNGKITIADPLPASVNPDNEFDLSNALPDPNNLGEFVEFQPR